VITVRGDIDADTAHDPRADIGDGLVEGKDHVLGGGLPATRIADAAGSPRSRYAPGDH